MVKSLLKSFMLFLPKKVVEITLCLCLLFVISRCAGSAVSVDKGDSTAPKEDVLEGANFQKLKGLLQSLGYEGIGLQYESEKTQELLIKVFSDPRSSKRQLKLIYTGLHLAYDPKYQSLTVGSHLDSEVVLIFIQKNIPVTK